MRRNGKALGAIASIGLLVMILSSFLVSAATVTENPYLRVVAEEVSPEPVEPGQDVTVKIRLINDGGEDAQEVSLKLLTNEVFFVKTESSTFEDKRSLCVGCSLDSTYYLVVDANAKSGLYPLEFEIYQDGVVYQPEDTINIKVVGKPDIVLETKKPQGEISAGESFELQVTAKNIGTGKAHNIKVLPDSDDVLMLGSNINLITEIDPGKTFSFNAEFIVKDSLSPDTYKFPILLSYVDEQGNSYEDSFDIGINVLDKADIGFQSIKISPSNPTLVDQVRMEGIIENTGSGDAEKVVVELITQDGAVYKAFVGQLKADDDSPFYFDVQPESAGVQTATLKVSYSDDFGTHSFETSLEKEVKRPTNNLLIALAVIVVIGGVVAYVVIKKKRAKK